MKWAKETPAEEGWYWMRFKAARGRGIVTRPCQVFRFKRGNMVVAFGGDTFVEGLDHGGWGLKYDGKLDKSIRFGPPCICPPPIQWAGTTKSLSQ